VTVARRRRAPLWVAAKRALPFVLIAYLSGCSKSDSPDAVWLETGAGEGQVVYPRALAYSKFDDSYYVIDRMARVQHIDHDGHFLSGWRMPAWAQGKPTGVSVNPADGNVCIPDTHYNRVMVYDSSGKLLKEFGDFGKGPGEFVYPCDVAFDKHGRVFVSEFGDHDRIQAFDVNTLKYLYEFGKFGDGPGEFSRPQSMLIDGETMYVNDACNHRICVFTVDGKFVRSMGHVGSGLGEFRFPYGLDMDSEGKLIVCEFGNNRVQRVDKETGQGLATWGMGGREVGQLAYPWAVAVGKKDRIVTVDAGNNRLQVFRF
jgi:DNA-binding beta-propeller fold protein YncE